MSDRSAIEWTDASWNPVTGCTEVSPGCDHCYAKVFAERWRGTPDHYYTNGFDVMLRPDKLDQPVRWAKPRRVFVNSMADLFHAEVPDDYIAQVFGVMAKTPQHTFQVLTKRHARMRHLLASIEFQALVYKHSGSMTWPLPNVWVGVSAEDQQWADIRVPALFDTPAAVRWVSVEPMLGQIKLPFCKIDPKTYAVTGLDWVVAGGESGRGARPMHPVWVQSLRDQCDQMNVPFLFKQWGAWAPARGAGQPTDRLVFQDGRSIRLGHANRRTLQRWDFVVMRAGTKGGNGRVLDGQVHDGYPGVA
ncbi:hypothetical protein SEA_TYPHA_76 [Mycobacterium phage Typha]|uniref:Phage Gp37/Gp68 family protein n=1 Tax=Mycobacterium phage Typha TaxID=2517971 RepID=A0A482JCN2_9CAUD|nr:hypothetical protein KCH40_gp093 [Mycobacterium phage Typha]QBP29731.1 hypothetical protein SEA_TYPHA_76 [Mycobacterium phage Typha]URM86518.1 hypothetical protein PBI_HILLTOPFARM_77 [Mycobacterium phage Hilltopfarm]